MAGRPSGNGNGRGGRKNGGGGQDVPRWVRTLFDNHERRMDELKRGHEEHEERMAALERAHEEHAERMDEMKREHAERMDELGKEQIQIRIQAGRLVQLVDDVRKGQEKLAQVVKEVHSRVVRLETPGRKG